jgi:Flp pilus assembly protein CpaB
MKSRLLTLMLALTVGAVAAVTIKMYVNGVEEKSLQGKTVQTVLVATQALPAGMSGDEILQTRSFTVDKVPQRYVTPGAFTKPEDLSGLTLADRISAGEQLTSERFRSTEQNAFLSDFPKGTEALTLPLGYVQGVAGHLKVGDRINAYATAEADDAAAQTLRRSSVPNSSHVYNPSKGGVTLLLLRNLPVEEINQPPAPQSGGALSSSDSSSGSMTLAVTPEQAALLIQTQQKAKLWFTLVP